MLLKPLNNAKTQKGTHTHAGKWLLMPLLIKLESLKLHVSGTREENTHDYWRRVTWTTLISTVGWYNMDMRWPIAGIETPIFLKKKTQER